jgi:hypothetical protein
MPASRSGVWAVARGWLHAPPGDTFHQRLVGLQWLGGMRDKRLIPTFTIPVMPLSSRTAI